MRGRCPMLERLELLVVQDVSALRACFVFLMVVSLSPVDLSVPFYTDALRVEAIAPAATAVLALFLVVLDSHQQAHEQVCDAVLRQGLHDLRVSPHLCFSCQNLELAFHRWLRKVPALVIQPWLLLATQLVYLYLLSHKGDAGCGWLHQLVVSPLVAVYTATPLLQSQVEPRRMSLINLAGGIYAISMVVALVFAGDTCVISLYCRCGSVVETVAGTVCFSVAGHLMYPVVMEHHSVLAASLLVGNVLVKVRGQFIATHSGGALQRCVESQWAIMGICVSALLTYQMSFVGRYRLGALNRRSFLSSLPPPARQGELQRRQGLCSGGM